MVFYSGIVNGKFYGVISLVTLCGRWWLSSRVCRFEGGVVG